MKEIIISAVIFVFLTLSYNMGVEHQKSKCASRIELLENTIKFGNWLKSDRKKPIVMGIHGKITDKKLLAKIEKIRKKSEKQETEEQETEEGVEFNPVFDSESCNELCEKKTTKTGWANCVSNCYERYRISEECSNMEDDEFVSCSESIKSDALNYYVELRDENKETGETKND